MKVCKNRPPLGNRKATNRRDAVFFEKASTYPSICKGPLEGEIGEELLYTLGSELRACDLGCGTSKTENPISASSLQPQVANILATGPQREVSKRECPHAMTLVGTVLHYEVSGRGCLDTHDRPSTLRLLGPPNQGREFQLQPWSQSS